MKTIVNCSFDIRNKGETYQVLLPKENKLVAVRCAWFSVWFFFEVPWDDAQNLPENSDLVNRVFVPFSPEEPIDTSELEYVATVQFEDGPNLEFRNIYEVVG